MEVSSTVHSFDRAVSFMLYNISMTKFQLVLTGIFGAFLIVGVIIFSSYRGNSGDTISVVIWGTIPWFQFQRIIRKLVDVFPPQ